MNNKIKLAIIIFLLLVSGYYVYLHMRDFGLMKPALIVQVSTNLTDEGTQMINNVTFERSGIPFFYKRADAVPDFPEIEVQARLNNLASSPATYWASVHNDGERTYSLKLFFRDGKEPKSGDILIIPIRLIGYTGDITYKTTAFYEWE